MTDEERASVVAWGCIEHGENHGVKLIVELIRQVRAEAMAEQRERDAQECDFIDQAVKITMETRRDYQSGGLLTKLREESRKTAQQCAAAIRNQD